MSGTNRLPTVAEEIGVLLGRIAEPIGLGDGLTHEELCDLREWLRALRLRHWNEVRAARQGAVSAEIVSFQAMRRVMAGESPCDVEPDPPRAA